MKRNTVRKDTVSSGQIKHNTINPLCSGTEKHKRNVMVHCTQAQPKASDQAKYNQSTALGHSATQ